MISSSLLLIALTIYSFTLKNILNSSAAISVKNCILGQKMFFSSFHWGENLENRIFSRDIFSPCFLGTWNWKVECFVWKCFARLNKLLRAALQVFLWITPILRFKPFYRLPVLIPHKDRLFSVHFVGGLSFRVTSLLRKLYVSFGNCRNQGAFIVRNNNL